MTSWRPSLPETHSKSPRKKGRSPKGKDRLTTIHHPFLSAKMLVSGRLTTKNMRKSNWIISPSRDEHLKNVWNHHLVTNNKPSLKKNGCDKEKALTWIRFVFLLKCQLPVFSGNVAACFMEWFVLLSLCGLLYACALYQQNKTKYKMSTKARLYNQRVTTLKDPFHPPNQWGILFWKTGCLSLSHDHRI